MNAVSLRKFAPLACFLAAAVLFYFVSRPAYRGYFSEDDLATLSWAPIAGADSYYGGILSPRSDPANFRPFATLYYSFLGRTAKLHYPPYVIVSQLFHILNVALLLFLLREFGFSWIAAGAGVLLFAFQAATMEAYWKPMYVFDLLCGTMCLAASLLYVRGRWLLALIPFWLAYKSKEIAVMLPAGLLAYELLLGRRKWKRLIPFFIVSLSFGLQALWQNGEVSGQGAYGLRFTGATALAAARFYSSALLYLPDLWVAFLLLPFLIRDRRLWLGIVFTLAVFIPLIFLPNRMFSVYWYVPSIGLAIAAAAIASRIPRWAAAAFFVVWLPLYFVQVREKRRDIMDQGDATRTMVAALQDYKNKIPRVRAIVYDNVPRHVVWWGVSGAIGVVFGHDVEPAYIGNPEAKEAFTKVPMALISFKPAPRGIDGLIRTHDGPQPYVRFSGRIEETQLKDGCYDEGYPVRWFAPRAELALYRPPEATQFEIVAFLPPSSLAKEGPAEVTVFEDGQSLGTVKLSATKSEPMRWKLSAGSAGEKNVTIVSKPVRHGGPEDPRDLGIAVQSLGYLPAP
jgi:hypothetical protein